MATRRSKFGHPEKAIFNTIPDMAWLKDGESRYIAVNEAYLAACGLKESEILNRTPLDIWPNGLGRIYLKTDRQVIRTGKRIHYEEERHDPSGGIRWYDTIKAPLRDADGHVIGTAGISRDITQRKKTEHSLARLNRLYAVRSQANQMVVRTRNRRDLLYRTCRILVQVGSLEIASVALFGKAGQALNLETCFPGNRRIRNGLTRLQNALHEEPISRLRHRKARPVICNEPDSMDRLPAVAAFARTHGAASFALFPLNHGQRSIGILFLLSKEPDFFSDDIITLVDELIADLSFAMTSIADAEHRQQAEEELFESRRQLRELSAYLQVVREEERSHISRELHDELGQTLTAMNLGLEWAKKELTPSQSNIHRRLEALIALTQQTTESVSRIASDLRPLMLDTLGLEPAIEWLIDRFREHTAIGVDFHCDFPLSGLGDDVNTTIFRTLQESLTNVSRHGKATWVDITFQSKGSHVHLIVSDNGCGIPNIDTATKNRLGLIGMRERIYAIDGQFSISSHPGHGTRIEAVFPTDLQKDAPR